MFQPKLHILCPASRKPKNQGKILYYIFLLFAFFSADSLLIAQSCLTTNIAAGKTVTTSAQESYAPGANITDGDLNTEWFSSVDGARWAYVDLTQAYSLCRCVVKWYSGNSASNFQIQGANNATNNSWTDLKTIPMSDYGQTGPGNAYEYHDIDLSASTGTYRYVRIYLNYVGGWGGKLKELEIYLKQPPSLPEVSLTGPADNSSFLQGATISLAATASVQGGTIAKVEFYQGTTKLGEDNSSPYQYAWTNVPAGNYGLLAKAIDLNDNITSSSQVQIHVDAPSTLAWTFAGNSISTSNFLGTTNSQPLIFKTNSIERFRITPDGKMGIKTSTIPTDADFAVNGQIWARKLKITQLSWADYVFRQDYKLRPLPELEAYIKRYRHLPEVPSSARVIKEGIEVGATQELLLKKIEELTLYIIELNKKISALDQRSQGKSN